MQIFSKTFLSEKYGQIVLIKQPSDSPNMGDEIRIFFKPVQLGVCNISFSFKDNDDGYQACDKTFDELSLEKTEELLKPTIEKINEAY